MRISCSYIVSYNYSICTCSNSYNYRSNNSYSTATVAVHTMNHHRKEQQRQAMKDFTHFDDQGNARMVDVSAKQDTLRTAVAEGTVHVSPGTMDLILSGGMKKGDVLTVAQVAGIMGAKRTPDLIPMCHPLLLSGVDLAVTADPGASAVRIRATVKCSGSTGVEMEALTAVSVAALTVYDMCKAVQRDITIGEIRLLHKSGGIHGDYSRES